MFNHSQFLIPQILRWGYKGAFLVKHYLKKKHLNGFESQKSFTMKACAEF